MPENRVFDELEDGTLASRWLDDPKESDARRLLALLKSKEDIWTEFSVEDLIGAIREYVEDDLNGYVSHADVDGEPPHPAVVAALEACINHLGDASMAYYASLK